MGGRHRSGPWARGLVALAALVIAGGPAVADDTSVALGRRIFLEGLSENGEPVRALVGAATPLTGSAVACGNCHGSDGRGRPEGGVVPPDIRWEELTKPYGHTRAGGRTHGPFDERSFARAITEGLDPAGQRIDATMPRFALSAGEIAALANYLKQLARDNDPGVADAALRLGTIVPDKGPAAEAGAAIRAMLRAYAGDLNEKGGIHGRRIELVFATDLAQAEERFAAQPVFALVSPYGVGSEAALARFADAKRLPVIAPFTLEAVHDDSPRVFYLYPGVAELARVLLDYAARSDDLATTRLAAFTGAADAGVAEALRVECKRRRCGGLDLLPAHAASEPGAVARLAHFGVRAVFFTGSERELAALMTFADRLGWRPSIYAPGAGAARAMFAAPPAFEGRLFVAYPARSDLQTRTPAAVEFERLRASRSLGTAHAAAQGFAYAAMSIVVEGLRQAGRDLSRERFAGALERLHRFDAGPTPPVSYGPGRRIGALGGYVMSVEPQKGFRPVSDWIAVEAF